jgi:CRP-like cAMP-binding protein
VLDRVTFRMIVARGAAKNHDAIYKSLKKAPVLKGLKSEQLGKLVDAVAAVHFNAGDTIIRKGDDGNIFYIITKGSVRVTKVGTGDAKEMTLKEGDYFGERALLTCEPRAANVIARTSVECLALDREAFNNLLGPLRDVLDDNLGMRVLHSIPILDKLKESEFKSLLAVFKKEQFKDGEVIISQDAPGNQFFIIRDGTAEVVKDVAGTTPASITRLSNGDYFGEGALLKDEPRNASVIARGSVLCFVVYRDDFERIFGPLKAIMSREHDSRVATAKTKVKRKSDAAAKSANDSQPKIKFEELRVLHTLGTGTFGRVKLVEHKPTKQTYALKMLQKAQVVAYRQQTNVMNEKDIMAEADHPFVLKLFATYKDKNCLYMLLELVQGGELFSLLHAKGGRLPVTDARFYSACSIDALVYLHDKSIVYRDLKPENLLLDSKGFIKVVDFGFAKRVTDKTFTLCGTPEYLAPELVLGKGHNRAVDYWAIGILVYEMLVGSSPFADHDNNDHMVICKNIVKGVVEYPKKFNDKGKDFVNKLLVRDAHQRLGMMKAGPEDIRSHPWFKSIDWQKLRDLEVAAPWVPSINNAFDTSNFEPYDEDSYVEPYKDNGSNWDANF